MIGIVGLLFLGFDEAVNANSLVFVEMVRRLFPGVIAGVLLSAVLAASMSTADSQLLSAGSAFASDVYKPIVRGGKASDREMLWIGRMVVLLVAVCALVIASNPNSGSIMGLVSNAWGVFGAAFGPAILASLFWRRATRNGVLAGIVVGGLTVLVWKQLALFGLYEIIPGFILSSLAIYIVSKMDAPPSEEITAVFDEVEKSGI